MIARVTMWLAAALLAPGAAVAASADTAETARATRGAERAPAPAADSSDLVLDALAAATSLPGARIEIRGYRASGPEGCVPTRAEASRAVERSGRQAVKLLGTDPEGLSCEAWAFPDVKLTAPAFVTTRAMKAGEPLEGAVRSVRREIKSGSRQLHELPRGARASRDLAAGTAIAESHTAGAVTAGEPVKVLLRGGSLSIETTGRAIACAGGRTCAQLASGKRVEGTLEGSTLVVEAP